MERLTAERGERTWKLYRIGWYVTLACFILALWGALYFMYLLVSGLSDSSETATFDTLAMMTLFVIASIILLGAGITRYQARLEGQHVELKLAINRLRDEIEALRKKENV